MKPRGNKTSNPARASRRARVVDLVDAGLGKAEVQEALGMSRTTLWRDLSALRECFKEEHSEKYAAFVKAQVGVFQLMEQHLLEGTIDPQTATAWKGIRQEISALLGLNSPSRSVSISVDAGEKLVGYRRFCHETRFLSAEQLEQVYAFASTINVPPPMRVIGPPASCELWGDEQQQLTEGAE